jgi:hypothetical protein
MPTESGTGLPMIAVALITAIATGFALGTLWAAYVVDDPELAERELDRQSRQSGWH